MATFFRFNSMQTESNINIGWIFHQMPRVSTTVIVIFFLSASFFLLKFWN